jgi:hypothetical protein
MSLPLITSSTPIPFIAPSEKPPEKNPVDAALSRAVYAKQREKLLQPSQSNRSDPKETRHISMEELDSIHIQCQIQLNKNIEHSAEQRIEIEMEREDIEECRSFNESLGMRHRQLKNRHNALDDFCTPFYLPLYNTIKKICLFLKTIFLFLFPCLCQNDESVNESLSLNPQMDATDPVLIIPLIDEPSEDSVDEDEMAHALPEAEKYNALKKQNDLLRAKLGLVDAAFQADKESKTFDAKELREKLMDHLSQLYHVEQQMLDLDQWILRSKSEIPQLQRKGEAFAASLDRWERKIVFFEELDLFTSYMILFQALCGCLQSLFDCSSSPENTISDG